LIRFINWHISLQFNHEILLTTLSKKTKSIFHSEGCAASYFESSTSAGGCVVSSKATVESRLPKRGVKRNVHYKLIVTGHFEATSHSRLMSSFRIKTERWMDFKLKIISNALKCICTRPST
jgi:hypothetical protein